MARIHWSPGTETLFYQGKASHEDPFSHHPEGETLDVFEFLARVLTQIPEPRRHNVHYFGAYSSKARARQNRVGLQLNPPQGDDSGQPDVEPKSSSKYRAALRKRWANLIRRVYKTDPLICPACGGRLRIISFISEHKTIQRILQHLNRRTLPSRAPPGSTPSDALF